MVVKHECVLSLLELIVNSYEWEIAHAKHCGSVAARHFYFSLVEQFIKSDSITSTQLKFLYHNQEFSERALRYKLRDFEKKGLIRFEQHGLDKRSKKNRPNRGIPKHTH